MTKLPARLTISNPRGRSEDDPIVRITVQCERSLCEAIEVEVPLLDFAKALFSRALIPCTMDFNESGVIGMYHEHKEELVTFEGEYTNRKSAANKAIQALEVDGWIGNRSDASNGHRVVSRDGNSVTARIGFHRFVKDPPAKDAK